MWVTRFTDSIVVSNKELSAWCSFGGLESEAGDLCAGSLATSTSSHITTTPAVTQSESGSRMGEGKRRCRSGPWDEGAGGVHKGHFYIPAGMVVRGGRRQSICQPALHMQPYKTVREEDGEATGLTESNGARSGRPDVLLSVSPAACRARSSATATKCHSNESKRASSGRTDLLVTVLLLPAARD